MILSMHYREIYPIIDYFDNLNKSTCSFTNSNCFFVQSPATKLRYIKVTLAPLRMMSSIQKLQQITGGDSPVSALRVWIEDGTASY